MNPHRGRTEAKPAPQPHPRFKVGDIVALINTAGAILPKHEERELLEARFQVARQLPDRQQSFHYRIKDTVTGQERAVTEERLREASSDSSPTSEAPCDHPNKLEHGIMCGGQDNISSDGVRAECDQANTTSDNERNSRSLDDSKLNLPRAARPAPARGR